MKRTTLPILTFLLILSAFVSCNGRKGDEIVVMSYNVRYSTATDGDNAWEIRKPATAAMLDDVNPDIFGVQEAQRSQIDYIMESCPRYKSFGVGRDDGANKGEHMSIFYNPEAIEMIDGGTFWLSETPDVPSKGWDAACRRTATWTLLKDKDSGKQFYYVNTHIDHRGKEAKVKGIALIIERMKEMNKEGIPMILIGDFNASPTDSCLNVLNTIMLSAHETAADSDDKGSYQAFGKKQKAGIIDYIFYSGFSSCKDFKVVDKTYADKPYISDHYPIVSTLVY